MVGGDDHRARARDVLAPDPLHPEINEEERLERDADESVDEPVDALLPGSPMKLVEFHLKRPYPPRGGALHRLRPAGLSSTPARTAAPSSSPAPRSSGASCIEQDRRRAETSARRGCSRASRRWRRRSGPRRPTAGPARQPARARPARRPRDAASLGSRGVSPRAVRRPLASASLTITPRPAPCAACERRPGGGLQQVPGGLHGVEASDLERPLNRLSLRRAGDA